ncbi:MAG: hypothetical protein ABEJ04_02905 [Halobacteriaceae archaeon]
MDSRQLRVVCLEGGETALGTEREEEEPSEPSREQVFELLSNQRRRHVMHYLRQHDREVELRELATQLAAWENEKPAEAVSHDERRRVYTALRQSHLPKMDEAGVIDYDPNGGVVDPRPGMDDVELYLDVVPEDEIPRSQYYLGLSALSAGVLALAWTDVPPFDLLPDLGWAAVCIGLFAVSAAVDTYYKRRRRLGNDGPPPEVNAGDGNHADDG